MKLMILDGNSVVNRAFYGVGYLSARSGQPTGAIYGFLNILQSLQDEEAPDALCVAFPPSAIRPTGTTRQTGSPCPRTWPPSFPF